VHRPGPEFVWSGLSRAAGRLYIPIASLCDGEGAYRGGIAAVDTTTRAVTQWETTAGTGSHAGGIWAWGGVSIDGEGDVFTATGNSLGSADEAEGHAERVVRLGVDLVVKASDHPLAPPFEIGDRDFGSTPLLLDAAGCAPQLAVMNKTGELFLYERDRIADGPVQRLRVSGALGVPLYGNIAYHPASRTLVYTSPVTPPNGSRFRRGLQALRLKPNCRLALRWQASFPSDAGSAPMIGRDVVYIASGRNGFLCAYRLRDGKRLWTGTLSKAGAMAAPTVLGNRLYAADWSGGVWAFVLGG
jgi:outer membrane protein assembly factor BamB